MNEQLKLTVPISKDTRLRSMLVGRVAECMPWLGPDESLRTGLWAASSLECLMAASEFTNGIDAKLDFGGYEIEVHLPEQELPDFPHISTLD